IQPLLDRSKLISETTGTVRNNLLEGALIVIFVLVFLLGNWRGGLIVASTIPLSLLFAFILMNVFDVWANLMSLGAIDFGIIVDGAVIIVEASV
ncbi:efflux RND transporter permease subunit, partial [Croceitalea sp. MTPC9]